MADILIRGMEMPTSGQVIAIYKLQGKFYASANGTELCPLIEVQPHGRLIDADALEQKINMLRIKAMTEGKDTNQYWNCLDAILQAPTVIKAEEGE